ncbi:MAG: hypothetical protein QY332_10310 [Anaerolineales bacterium]|nr:MAG: hypothetical protein QY332_10310 [Anaerolineales bacterium]
MTVAMDLSLQGQRSLGDILNAERRMRAVSDQAVRDLRQVLLDMAVRLDGKRMEDIRHRDPSAPGNWTVAEWRSFVNSIPVQSTWDAVLTGNLSAKEDHRISDLIAEVQTLTAELQSSRAMVADLEEQINRLKTSVRQAVLPGTAFPAIAPAAVPAEAIAPMSVLLADAKLMLETVYPRGGVDPEALTLYVGNRAGGDARKHLKRIWLVLYLIGARGITSHMELNLLTSSPFGSSLGSGAGRRTLDDMKKAGLVEVFEYCSLTPATTQHAAILTEKGRELCQKLFPDHPILRGEVSRILDLAGDDAARIALISSFALQSRRRGWYVLVSPPVKEADIQPDVWVGRGDKSLYALLDDGSDRATMERWKKLSALNNGVVAIAATTTDVRERIAADCVVAGLHGVAMELETTIKESYANVEEGKSPLWSSEF